MSNPYKDYALTEYIIIKNNWKCGYDQNAIFQSFQKIRRVIKNEQFTKKV